MKWKEKQWQSKKLCLKEKERVISDLKDMLKTYESEAEILRYSLAQHKK